MAFAYFHVIQHVNTAPLHLRFGGGTREITVSADDRLHRLRYAPLFVVVRDKDYVLMAWWQSVWHCCKPKGPRFNSWVGRALLCGVCMFSSCL